MTKLIVNESFNINCICLIVHNIFNTKQNIYVYLKKTKDIPKLIFTKSMFRSCTLHIKKHV